MPQQPAVLKQEILFNADGNERIKFWKLNWNLNISARALAFGKSSGAAVTLPLLPQGPLPLQPARCTSLG